MTLLIRVLCAVVLLPVVLVAGGPEPLRASGDLSVTKGSSAASNIVSAGETITYYISYDWTGDGPATNVAVTDAMPAGAAFVSSSPAPSSQSGDTYIWQLGGLADGDGGAILITVQIDAGLAPGTTLSNTATISSADVDFDPMNNQSTCVLTVQLPAPDLYVFHYGLLESLEAGLFFTGEKGVPFEIMVYYWNLSATEATGSVLTHTLPAGTAFVSANPAPTNVAGQILTWDLGTLEGYASGTITVSVRPDQTGSFQSGVEIASAEADRDPASNASTFLYEIVPLLQPLLLKPGVGSAFASPDTVVTGKAPTFVGLAKAGATVTVYTGSPSGCFGDLSLCNPVPVGSTVAGSDRQWSIPMSALSAVGTYHLYLRAESGGELSSPPFGFWSPLIVRVDSVLDAAGVDLDNFVVGTNGQDRRPGFAGGKASTTPNEPVEITIRQSACDEILTNTGLWTNHTLRLVIGGGEVMLPVSQVTRATATVPGKLGSFDFRYTVPGQDPGSTVEVWYKPVAYDSTCAFMVALTWVKFVDILIDPAGYVYDVDLAGGTYEWPNVPPTEALITTATVSALARTGDDQWELWNASASGQVNPQVTDVATPDNILVAGYYAFYVPSGQYRVEATAAGYSDHTSPILTVIDAPVFYNVGMSRSPGSATSVHDRPQDGAGSAFVAGLVLEQNYPNPFNPKTTIAYGLPAAGAVTLRVYDALGRVVATLVDGLVQGAGRHAVSLDASTLASGTYYYQLSVRGLAGEGTSAVTRRLLLVR